MSQFILFFDRRAWANGALTIEAESADEAWRLYQQGLLDQSLENVSWDEDDVEISLVAVEERDS